MFFHQIWEVWGHFLKDILSTHFFLLLLGLLWLIYWHTWWCPVGLWGSFYFSSFFSTPIPPHGRVAVRQSRRGCMREIPAQCRCVQADRALTLPAWTWWVHVQWCWITHGVFMDKMELSWALKDRKDLQCRGERGHSSFRKQGKRSAALSQDLGCTCAAVKRKPDWSCICEIW